MRTTETGRDGGGDERMSRTEKAELTVLCLVEDGDRILLQNRVKVI